MSIGVLMALGSYNKFLHNSYKYVLLLYIYRSSHGTRQL